jgi:septum formation protein
MMEQIILASASPRRQEYFRLLGIPFISIAPSIDESCEPGADPTEIAKEIALRKVKKVISSTKDGEFSWVCGADTIIALDGKIYGKPADLAEAAFMLNTLQGREHEVITAIALYNGKGKFDCRSVTSAITFAPLSPGEIEWYLNTNEWKDAAGAYKIQGLASCFISSINGSYSSIVGLPLRDFYVMLKENNYPFGV